jgi:hypothetical protein
MDKTFTVKTVGWFVGAVKEEVVEELDEKVFKSRENADDEYDIRDTKRELPLY